LEELKEGFLDGIFVGEVAVTLFGYFVGLRVIDFGFIVGAFVKDIADCL
jgi:hypothetical protein